MIISRPCNPLKGLAMSDKLMGVSYIMNDNLVEITVAILSNTMNN